MAFIHGYSFPGIDPRRTTRRYPTIIPERQRRPAIFFNAADDGFLIIHPKGQAADLAADTLQASGTAGQLRYRWKTSATAGEKILAAKFRCPSIIIEDILSRLENRFCFRCQRLYFLFQRLRLFKPSCRDRDGIFSKPHRRHPVSSSGSSRPSRFMIAINCAASAAVMPSPAANILPSG